MRILGLIPARGGSKGVPKKNSKLLAGKPLIAYSIEAALGATHLDTVTLSSDSDAIIAIATAMGVEVPFKRPAELATDASPTIDTVIHTLQFYAGQGVHYDAVCLLQPTNPFRNSAFIDDCIHTFQQAQTDSLISVLAVPHEYNPHWVFEPDAQGQLKISTGESQIISRRQELPPAYHRDGSIYITKTSVLLNQNSLYGDSMSYVVSDPELHVNIDTPDDWEQAELLAKKLHR